MPVSCLREAGPPKRQEYLVFTVQVVSFKTNSGDDFNAHPHYHPWLFFLLRLFLDFWEDKIRISLLPQVHGACIFLVFFG